MSTGKCSSACLLLLVVSSVISLNTSAQRWTKIIREDDVREQTFGGNVVVVGDYVLSSGAFNDWLGQHSGAVFAYSLSDPDFPFVQVVLPSDGGEFRNFGDNMAANGNHVIIANRRDAVVYHFELEGSQFIERQILEVPDLVSSDAYTQELQFDGTWVVYHGRNLVFDDGSERQGYAVFVFKWNGERFEFSDIMSYPDASTEFGSSMCLTRGALAVSDPERGLIAVFEERKGRLVLADTVYLPDPAPERVNSIACERGEFYFQAGDRGLSRLSKDMNGVWYTAESRIEAPIEVDATELLSYLQLDDGYLFLLDRRQVGFSGRPGLFLVFQKQGTKWAFLREVWTPELRDDTYGFGDAIALSPQYIIVGSQWETYFPPPDPNRNNHYFDQNGAIYITNRRDIAPKFRTIQDSHPPESTPGSAGFSLAFPNPADQSTTIRYTVAETAPVSITLFDALGRQLLNAYQDIRDPGDYEATFDLSAVSSGIIFYRIMIGRSASTKSLVVSH